jgi:hypothetical protein
MCTNSRPHPQVRKLFFFSLICKLAKIAYLKSTRRVNCAAGVRIYLYIYMYVVRGAERDLNFHRVLKSSRAHRV